MKIKELDKWYSAKEYDPENKEVSKILRLGKVKGRDVLIIGTYGVMSISFKILKDAKSVTAIHNNKYVIDYCKKKSEKINYYVGNILNLKFLDKTFDVIISPWDGLHYQKNINKLIKKFKMVLRDNGVLLIEEADENREFVKILNSILTDRKDKIKKRRIELKRALIKEFEVREDKLSTYYDFKNEKQFKGYFKREIMFDEKIRFTKKMESGLDRYLLKKQMLKVGEKSIFFSCKK